MPKIALDSSKVHTPSGQLEAFGMPKLVRMDREFDTGALASAGDNGVNLSSREWALTLGVEDKVRFWVVAAQLPERAKFVAFEIVNRWIAIFEPVDVDFSSSKVNLVPAEVCGLADAQGVGIDDRDEPLVAEAVLRGLSGGFLKHSDF